MPTTRHVHVRSYCELLEPDASVVKPKRARTSSAPVRFLTEGEGVASYIARGDVRLLEAALAHARDTSGLVTEVLQRAPGATRKEMLSLLLSRGCAMFASVAGVYGYLPFRLLHCIHIFPDGPELLAVTIAHMRTDQFWSMHHFVSTPSIVAFFRNCLHLGHHGVMRAIVRNPCFEDPALGSFVNMEAQRMALSPELEPLTSLARKRLSVLTYFATSSFARLPSAFLDGDLDRLDYLVTSARTIGIGHACLTKEDLKPLLRADLPIRDTTRRFALEVAAKALLFVPETLRMVLARCDWGPESHHLFPDARKDVLFLLLLWTRSATCPAYASGMQDIWMTVLFPMIMNDETTARRNWSTADAAARYERRVVAPPAPPPAPVTCRRSTRERRPVVR